VGPTAVGPGPVEPSGPTAGNGGVPVVGPSGNARGAPVGAGGTAGTPSGNGGAPGPSAGAGGAGGDGPVGAGGTPPAVDPDLLTGRLGDARQVIRRVGRNARMTAGSKPPWNQPYTLEGANALGLSILRIGTDEN